MNINVINANTIAMLSRAQYIQRNPHITSEQWILTLESNRENRKKSASTGDRTRTSLIPSVMRLIALGCERQDCWISEPSTHTHTHTPHIGVSHQLKYFRKI